jgi:Ca-activated chloride channel family protein
MIACAVALLLLVDVSGSVSAEHHRLQREGIAEALRTPAMARLVQGEGPIAITLIEWDSTQTAVLPWRVLRDAGTLRQAADDIVAAPRAGVFGSTHVGDAIEAGLAAMAQVPCLADRVVLDVSGDGSSNGGGEAAAARDRAQTLGVQINGLPIVTEAEPDLAEWYRANVATFDGFVIVADGFENVARAMRRKIVLEVALMEIEP